MRGEDYIVYACGVGIVGSPPHARGRLASAEPVDAILRITPACAGKTIA